jgi:hypothetical protein
MGPSMASGNQQCKPNWVDLLQKHKKKHTHTKKKHPKITNKQTNTQKKRCPYKCPKIKKTKITTFTNKQTLTTKFYGIKTVKSKCNQKKRKYTTKFSTT